MSRNIQDLEQDVVELQELISSVKRPNIQKALKNLLITTNSQLQALRPKKVQPVPSTQSNNQQPIDPIKYIPLNKYSFEQEGKKVKIYFTFDNIGNECTAQQIQVNFQKQAVSLLIHGYRNSNHIFSIKKLNGQIDTQSCVHSVKTNMVILTLIKKDSKHWGQLQYKQDTFSKKKEQDKTMKDDPNAALMNMMKKMYEQGDENMKKTIAQAWTQANQNKGKKGSDLQ